MSLKYVPDPYRPDDWFEFDIDEITSYLTAHLAGLKTAPEYHSPHKQIVRDYHQCLIQPLIKAQACIQQAIEQGYAESLIWEDLNYWYSITYLIANLLEYQCGRATCFACQEVYSAAELIMYDYTWAEYAGRLFTCPHDHELMRSTERLGVLVIPMEPLVRTLRQRRAKIE